MSELNVTIAPEMAALFKQVACQTSHTRSEVVRDGLEMLRARSSPNVTESSAKPW